MFSEIDYKPVIILRYLDACKADGTDPDLNIKDLHQQTPEVTLKKTKKRKAASEGPSQQTPKKRGNLSSVNVLNSSVVPTFIPTPASFEISIPIPIIDDTEPEFDPSESLTLRRSRAKPHNPKPTTTTEPEFEKVLSEIDQHSSAPHTENPNPQPETPHSP